MHITPALGRWESRVQEFEVSPSCIMNQRQSGLHENLSQKKKKIRKQASFSYEHVNAYELH